MSGTGRRPRSQAKQRTQTFETFSNVCGHQAKPKSPFLVARGPTQQKNVHYTSNRRPGLISQEVEKPHGMEVAGTQHPSWTGRQGSPRPGDGLGTQIGPHQTQTGSPGTFQTALSSALTQQKCPFSGPTGGKSAQHRGSQPEENQHIDLNQPNPGLMSKSREVKPHGTEVGQNWVRYPQTDLGTPGCKGTLEPKTMCASSTRALPGHP